LDIMKDYRASVINTQQVIESVGCLFHGHPLLVQGLAGFLPHIQTERQRQQELLQLSDKQLKSQWVTAQDKSRGPSSTPNPTHPSSTLQPTSTSRGLQSTPIW
jgi:histone deacetylase complex regulatory component SIN3